MGVQKAKKFVRQQLGEAPAQSLPHGTKVLIDGSGWFHQVARSLGRTDLGGDYAALDEAVTRAVSQLRLQRYDVIVYRDGSVRQLKADTQHERLAQRREEWSNLTHWCRTDEEDALLVAPTAQFPMPPLASRQFYASLARLRVAVHECAGEADQDLARASAEDDRAVVLGDDSDFMFFRGARYVSFEHWKRLAAGKPVPVWTREALAHGLGLAEDLVVEFAILLGNDYTSVRGQNV